MQLIKLIGDFFGTIIHPFVVIFINLLIGLYHLLTVAHIPYAFGFSIIAITIFIRFITYPLVSKQLRTSKKMQDLAPHVADLKKLHKNDQKRFFAEQQKLYKEHGVSQVAGCLPSLIQLPFLYGFYIMLQHIVVATAGKQIDYVNSLVLPQLRISHALDTTFFGIHLEESPKTLIAALSLIILVPVITGVLTFIQTKMISPKPIKKYNSDSPKEKKEKDVASDMGTQMQGQMLILMPLMIGFFSFSFPLGLSLYWNTSTIFGIIQQYKIYGMGGLEPLWKRIRKP